MKTSRIKSFGLAGITFFLLLAFVPHTTPFVSKKGKFSINFKEKPSEQQQDVPTEVGNIKMYMFMHEESLTKAYMVAYCDYPKELIANADPTELLNGSKEGVIGKFDAVITHEEIAEFMGHPSINFGASGPQYHTEYKLLLVKNRLYQVGILSTSKIESIDVDGFMRTFKLLK